MQVGMNYAYFPSDDLYINGGYSIQHVNRPREAAPVMLYVTDQFVRERMRLEDILKGRGIPYRVLDVTDDESTRSWALTKAQATEFPLLFVAGESLGGFEHVLSLDAKGELRKKVYG